jgi:peptidoglycan/LPS O-acetylase OafA/YrhL
VLRLWHDKFARRLALVGLLLVFLWFATMQESRYLIHFYVLSAVFAAAGWQEADRLTALRGKLLCAMVVTVLLAYGTYMIGLVQVPALGSVFSATQPKEWRDTHPCSSRVSRTSITRRK